MNIAIIGAGPAGIISARNAIKAGHCSGQVILATVLQ